MYTLVSISNRALTGLFDLLLLPFAAFAPIWGLLAASLASGVLMVWIFGRVSNQQAVGRTRERIRGNLLGMRLFGDDVRLLFKLWGRVMGATATYMRHAVPPVLVMLVPVVLILIQLDLRFTVRPLAPDERTVVTVKTHEGTPLEDVTLRVPAGVVLETPGVRSPSLREVSWRVRVEREGEHRLEVSAGGEPVTKLLVAGRGWRSVPTRRTGESAWQTLLHPGEPPISAADRIASVVLAYPDLELSLLGFRVDWLVTFFVASLVFGFLFRKPLGVQL